VAATLLGGVYLALTQTPMGLQLVNEVCKHLLPQNGAVILNQGDVENCTGAIHFIDVGQGDAVLIEQDGEFCLIDAGTAAAEDELLDYLSRVGAGRLKLLVLTHPHADHIGSARAVLEYCRVDTVLLPDENKCPGEISFTMAQIKQTMEERGIPGIVGREGQTYAIGSGTLTVVGEGIESENMNNISLVTRFDAANLSYLSTGDAEQEAEEALAFSQAALQADVFKAGHHGSAGSNTAAFLMRAAPRLVVASCGKDNDYGHPHPETLERYAAIGAQVHRTDQEGSVVVYATPEGYRVRTEKGVQQAMILRPAA